MAFGENTELDRIRSLEAQLQTALDQIRPMKERMRNVMESLGAKERSDGSFAIDYDKLVERLGLEQAFKLRKIIDARYGISGEPGEKPRVRVKAVT